MTLNQIEQKVDFMMSWMAKKKVQQISNPLDQVSLGVRQSRNAVILNRIGLQRPVIFTDLLGIGLGVRYQNEKKFLWAMKPLAQFTVNPATDIFTSERVVNNGDVIALASSGTLPTGVDSITYYTVTNKSGNTFKLSGVNVTTTGSGSHYFGVID